MMFLLEGCVSPAFFIFLAVNGNLAHMTVILGFGVLHPLTDSSSKIGPSIIGLRSP